MTGKTRTIYTSVHFNPHSSEMRGRKKNFNIIVLDSGIEILNRSFENGRQKSVDAKEGTSVVVSSLASSIFKIRLSMTLDNIYIPSLVPNYLVITNKYLEEI